VGIDIKDGDLKFALLIEEYKYMKTFNSSKDYEDMECDKILLLIELDSKITEVEEVCKNMK